MQMLSTTKTISTTTTTRKSVTLNVRVEDDTFRIPASGAPYIVSNGGETLQWGRTDSSGRFQLPINGVPPKQLTVRLLDGDGRVIVDERINPRIAEPIVTIPLETWQLLAPLARVAAKPKRRGHYERYRQIADRFAAASKDRGVSASAAIDRCLQAALAQDQLHNLIDRALGHEPGALKGLMSALKSRRSSTVKTAATFGPGSDELFADIVRLGARHPGVGKAALDAMIDLGRDAGPVVRFGRGGGGAIDLPNDWFPGGPNPGKGGPIPDVPVVGGGDLRPGDPTLKCEVALTKAYDTAIEPAIAVRGGSGGQQALSIVSITPNFERQSGGRTVRIEVLGAAEHLVDGSTSVPVSFPGHDGRIAATGTIVATLPSQNEFLHQIDVIAPIRTVEGVVQVLGFPTECTGGQEPIVDASLSGLLDTVSACTGVSHGGTHGRLAGSNASPCEATPANWLGGVPDIHFRWDGAENQTIYGDERICVGGTGGYRLTTTSDALVKFEPRDRARYDRLEPIHPAGLVTSVFGDDDDEDGCRVRHESVFMHLEADQPLWVEYLTTNDPTAPTSLALTPPLDPALVGGASHLISGTYYHVDWDNTDVVPRTSWQDIGIASVSGQWAEISVWRNVLGPVAASSVQLLRASASNTLPGFGHRVLEVFREVHPARIESIVVRPDDGRALSPSDAQVGPDEQVTIDVRVTMPTFAELGVTGTVELKLGTEVIGTSTFDRHSKNAITLSVATINLRDFPHEGRTPVTATVTFAYSDGTAFPDGVALGQQAGVGAETSIVVLPRILVMGFPGQWGRVFKSNGEFDGSEWAVQMMREIRSELRQGDEQKLVTRLIGTGRVKQELPDAVPGEQEADWFFQNWGGTAVDVFDEQGEFKQERDGDEQTRGCVQLFASEWAFRRGNNELGGPQRPWDDQENAWMVDQYIDYSEIGDFITEKMAGRRKTYFAFIGHSRGCGASYNIMSWLERTKGADSFHVIGAAFFDAMHTDGYFQPIIGFPLCADAMLHFYALRPTGPVTDKMNRYWNDDERPDCPGSTFDQVSVDTTHGSVPEYPGVHGRARALLVGQVQALINRTIYGG